jgi:hypothetical protein
MQKMKSVLLISLLNITVCAGQKDLLSFFYDIPKDSIVNTLDFGRKSIRGKNIADTVSIYYFFENNKGNLYATGEAYNMDDNTYTQVKYKRIVEAIFSKTISKHLQILSYWLDGTNYLAIYNQTNDSIISTYPFCIFTDGAGESFTHSILFPNNYIFTVETAEKTRIKLIETDTVKKQFIEHKNIIMEGIMIIEDMLPANGKYQKALRLAGISEEGKLYR